MRCGPIFVVLALMAGAAPAWAQWNGVGNPNPVTPEPAAKKHPVHKAAAVKPAATPAAKPVANVPVPPAAPKPQPAATEAAKVKPAPEPANQRAAKVEPAKAAPPAEVTSLSAADRLKIQAALAWSGDFAGANKDDDPMEGAIRTFQKRNRSKVTGVLTSEQRTELINAADNHEKEFGWSVVVDPATGMRIGLPAKLVPNARDGAHGTHWSSPHGEVQVETFRLKSANLSALFEQEKKKYGRTIEHSALSDDGFVISGMQGLKLFTVRAKQRDGEVRGFTFLYDQMMEGIVAPAMVAMASAFSPFPEAAAPFAALSQKVQYGTGLIVSSNGYIVTARKIAQGCQVIVADGLGNAERIGEDESHGLALLRVYGAHKLPAVALAPEAAKAGDITLIGIPDPKEQDGQKKLTEIRARLAGGSAIALREPVPMAGFSGAAAIDAQGQFVGMMNTSNFTLASAEPTLPPVRLIDTTTIRGFLAAHHVPAAQAGGDARAAAVRIICVRK